MAPRRFPRVLRRHAGGGSVRDAGVCGNLGPSRSRKREKVADTVADAIAGLRISHPDRVIDPQTGLPNATPV